MINRTRQKNKRGDIEKWDQLATLRLQTGRRHQKSPASLWETDRRTDSRTDGRTDGQTDRRTDRQRGRERGMQTYRQTEGSVLIYASAVPHCGIA